MSVTHENTMTDLVLVLLERHEHKTKWLNKLKEQYKTLSKTNRLLAGEVRSNVEERTRLLREIKQLRSAMRTLGFNYERVNQSNIECLLPAYREIMKSAVVENMHRMLDRVCAIAVHNNLIEAETSFDTLQYPYRITIEDAGFFIEGSTAAGDIVSGTVPFEKVTYLDHSTPKHIDFERASNPNPAGAFYDIC